MLGQCGKRTVPSVFVLAKLAEFFELLTFGTVFQLHTIRGEVCVAFLMGAILLSVGKNSFTEFPT
jgi:hypothetical protein